VLGSPSSKAKMLKARYMIASNVLGSECTFHRVRPQFFGDVRDIGIPASPSHRRNRLGLTFQRWPIHVPRATRYLIPAAMRLSPFVGIRCDGKTSV